MSRIYVCDRCGARIDDNQYPDPVYTTRLPWDQPRELTIGGFRITDNKYDLCRACSCELHDWWTKGKE